MLEHSLNLSEFSPVFPILKLLLTSFICMLYNDLFGMFLRWPVRTISFNHTGEYIASASEDLFIDIVSIHIT